MDFQSSFCQKATYAKYLPAVFLVFGLASCAVAGKQKAPPLPAQYAPMPDYSRLSAWAAHPDKHDLSDSVPAPLRPLVTDTTIDVFFLHPTSYLNEKSIDEKNLANPAEKFRWNADINDATINLVTDKGSIFKQASVFNQYRVFAPRYRQAHIKAFYIADSLAAPFFDTAYADVKNAFIFYLATENRGKKFMIASHSQGTLHAERLIKELIEGQPLQSQLVVAYLLGLPVKEDYFTGLPPCNNSSETGCFVSWRTFKKGYEPPFVQKEIFKAVVVNPLTWTREQEWVDRKKNKGALLYNFNKPMPYNVGAGIHGNVLWSNKPRFFGNILLTRKNYHVGDINLFWLDIRENAALRVKTAKQKQGKGT